MPIGPDDAAARVQSQDVLSRLREGTPEEQHCILDSIERKDDISEVSQLVEFMESSGLDLGDMTKRETLLRISMGVLRGLVMSIGSLLAVAIPGGLALAVIFLMCGLVSMGMNSGHEIGEFAPLGIVPAVLAVVVTGVCVGIGTLKVWSQLENTMKLWLGRKALPIWGTIAALPTVAVLASLIVTFSTQDLSGHDWWPAVGTIVPDWLNAIFLTEVIAWLGLAVARVAKSVAEEMVMGRVPDIPSDYILGLRPSGEPLNLLRRVLVLRRAQRLVREITHKMSNSQDANAVDVEGNSS